MDPISAVGVVSGGFQIIHLISETAHGLRTLQGKFKNADHRIRALISELDAIGAALTELDHWARNHLRDSPRHKEYDEGLEVALDGCRTIMEVLSEGVFALTQCANEDFTALGFRARVRAVWNEEMMRDHQDRLHAQVLALHLLLQARQW